MERVMTRPTGPHGTLTKQGTPTTPSPCEGIRSAVTTNIPAAREPWLTSPDTPIVWSPPPNISAKDYLRCEYPQRAKYESMPPIGGPSADRWPSDMRWKFDAR